MCCADVAKTSPLGEEARRQACRWGFNAQKNLIRFAVDCLTKVEETSLSSFPWKELARVARD